MVSVAVIQCDLSHGEEKNCDRIESLIREARRQGAELILPPELFAGRYFCQHQDADFFSLAKVRGQDAFFNRFSSLAKELGVVLPVSFFEKSGPEFYNSVVVYDADGSDLGLYRKSHIPDGPGYQEKFYFKPGDTGFKVFHTKVGAIGVGICWDQWFPECARAMTLLGADILLYPTAIGSEPEVPELDSRLPWMRVMQGHAVANAIPVMAANRIGLEDELAFFGSSFICDHRGEILGRALGENEEACNVTQLNFEESAKYRADWGFFRDRRTDLYRG